MLLKVKDYIISKGIFHNVTSPKNGQKVSLWLTLNFNANFLANFVFICGISELCFRIFERHFLKYSYLYLTREQMDLIAYFTSNKIRTLKNVSQFIFLRNMLSQYFLSEMMKKIMMKMWLGSLAVHTARTGLSKFGWLNHFIHATPRWSRSR